MVDYMYLYVCVSVHNTYIRLSNGDHRDICFFCFQIYFDDDNDCLNELSGFFLFFSEHCSIVLQLDVTVKYIRKKKQINYYYLLGQIVIWKKRQTKNYRFIDAQYKLLRRVNNE